MYGYSGTLEQQKAHEQEADCWAYQLLVDGGMLTGSRLEVLERDFRSFTGDALHLGGEALLNSLHACLDARTNTRQWRAMLT